MAGLQLSCNARMIAPGGGLSSDNFWQSKGGFSGGLLFSNIRDFTRESLHGEPRTGKYPRLLRTAKLRSGEIRCPFNYPRYYCPVILRK